MVSEGKNPQLELPRQLMPSALDNGAAVRATSKAVVVKRIVVIVDRLGDEWCFDVWGTGCPSCLDLRNSYFRGLEEYIIDFQSWRATCSPCGVSPSWLALERFSPVR